MDLLHVYYDLVTIHALVNKIRNVKATLEHLVGREWRSGVGH